MCEEFESASELDMNISNDVDDHDFDELEDNFVQESYEDVVKLRPADLEFDDDNFFVEYELLSYGFNINKHLDVGFYVTYESFSFDPSYVTLSLLLQVLIFRV